MNLKRSNIIVLPSGMYMDAVRTFVRSAESVWRVSKAATGTRQDVVDWI
jgi:hypothetical protein